MADQPQTPNFGSGGFRADKPKTPRAIEAEGAAKENFARVVVAGIVLGGLVIALIIDLFRGSENVKDILLIMGGTLGFLIGRDTGRGNNNSS